MFYMPMKYLLYKFSWQNEISFTKRWFKLTDTTLYALYSFLDKGYLQRDDVLRK